jgi:uncharacterized OsmC-like protein
MSDAFYTVDVDIEKVAGVHRRISLPTGDTFAVGVHGPIKAHYRLDQEEDRPLPVDYLVGATGAWLLGTLNGALEAREIRLEGDAIGATATGTNEIRDRLPVLTAVHVAYRLRTPAGTREVVERALRRHASRCPTAMTLKGAVKVTWSAEVDEAGTVWSAEGDRDDWARGGAWNG